LRHTKTYLIRESAESLADSVSFRRKSRASVRDRAA